MQISNANFRITGVTYDSEKTISVTASEVHFLSFTISKQASINITSSRAYLKEMLSGQATLNVTNSFGKIDSSTFKDTTLTDSWLRIIGTSFTSLTESSSYITGDDVSSGETSMSGVGKIDYLSSSSLTVDGYVSSIMSDPGSATINGVFRALGSATINNISGQGSVISIACKNSGVPGVRNEISVASDALATTNGVGVVVSDGFKAATRGVLIGGGKTVDVESEVICGLEVLSGTNVIAATNYDITADNVIASCEGNITANYAVSSGGDITAVLLAAATDSPVSGDGICAGAELTNNGIFAHDDVSQIKFGGCHIESSGTTEITLASEVTLFEVHQVYVPLRI